MRVLWSVLGVWFVSAFVLALVNPPPLATLPERLLTIAGPIALSVLLIALLPGFRRVMRQIPLRTLMLLHVIRLPVGGLFLVLANRDLLPDEFGWWAGGGDMIVGAGALALVLLYRRSAMHPALLVGWSLLGLLDFMNVQRIVTSIEAAGRGAEFVAMQGPPLALVPYFAVPLLFFTHLYMLGRLSGNDRTLFLQPTARAE